MILSGFCSLMLGSALLSAHAGVSMAGIGAGAIGDKVSNQVLAAGWSVPAPAPAAQPSMSPARTIPASYTSASGELAPLISELQSGGKDDPLPGRFAILLGISNGPEVPMKAFVVKDPSVGEMKGVGLVVEGNATYLVLVDHFPGRMTLYLTDAQGLMLKGYYLSKADPQPVGVNSPDFTLQKTYWKNHIGTSAVASSGAGS